MTTRSWLRNLFASRTPRTIRKAPARRQLHLELLEDRRVPATIFVNWSVDTLLNPTTVTVATLRPDVTLRDALNAANNTPGPDTVVLQRATTYNLGQIDNSWYGPNGLPAISSEITIEGNGSTIQRNTASGTPNFRLFYVASGMEGELPLGTLMLHDLTLAGGVAQGGNGLGGGGGGMGAGGAIFNQGTLQLTGVTLTNNQALGGSGAAGRRGGGGGMGSDASGYNGGGFGNFPSGFGGTGGEFSGGGGGFLTGANGASRSGTGGGLGGFGGRGGGSGGAAGDGGGGGFAYHSPYWVAGGAFGAGGMGYNDRDLGQDSGGGGGGVGGGGGGGVADSTGFGGYGGGGGFGGGGGSYGGDGGFGGGGGRGGGDGGFGGGDAGGFFGGGGGGAGMGGAIFNMGASTVRGSGVVLITNSTLTANTARGGDGSLSGSGGSGYGGALFNLNGSVTLNNATLARNVVIGGGHGLGGSTGRADGGAVYNLAFGNIIQTGAATSAHLVLSNSILSNTTGGSDLASNGINGKNTNSAAITGSTNLVLTKNLSTNTSLAPGVITITARTPSERFLFDPRLGPLQDNGGPTQTMAIWTTSPAYGAGNSNVPGLPSTDQRGRPRTVNGRLDLGAFQQQNETPSRAPARQTIHVGATTYRLIGAIASADNNGDGPNDLPPLRQ